MKNRLLVLSILLLTFLYSCSDENSFDSDFKGQTVNEFKASIENMEEAINDFQAGSSLKSDKAIRITSISSLSEDGVEKISRVSGMKDDIPLLYAVVVGNKETYFMSGDKGANAIYATLDVPIKFEKNEFPENLPPGFS